MLGSPPPCRAAMMIARLSLLNSLPRLASMAPFLCLIVAQCEWPDMAPPSLCVAGGGRLAPARPSSRSFLGFQELELLLQFPVPAVHSTAPVALVEVRRA